MLPADHLSAPESSRAPHSVPSPLGTTPETGLEMASHGPVILNSCLLLSGSRFLLLRNTAAGMDALVLLSRTQKFLLRSPSLLPLGIRTTSQHSAVPSCDLGSPPGSGAASRRTQLFRGRSHVPLLRAQRLMRYPRVPPSTSPPPGPHTHLLSPSVTHMEQLTLRMKRRCS